MLSKKRVLDLASEFASSSKQLAVKSFGPHEKSWPRYDLSGRGRPRFKRIIERFLCHRDHDSTRCSPASIRVPAAIEDGKGFVVNFARTCLDWFKPKPNSTSLKEEDMENNGEAGEEREENEDKKEEDEEDIEENEEDEEDEDENEEDEDPLATFRPVLSSMDLGGLPIYASSLRRSKAGISSNELAEFACTVDSEPMVGSFNVLFPVVFNDGVKWLFKIPAAGYAGHWDESAARSLKSEALTMRMLQRKTSVPIPKVLSYDSSLENEFNCPFILMEFIDGKPLYEKWYDGFNSAEAQEEFRERALQTIASATVQLYQFKCSQGGAPSFDEDGILQMIEPVRVYDAPAMYDRMYSGSTDEGQPFCEIGPFNNAKDYFRSMLDKHREPKRAFGEAVLKLLRLFISWIPSESAAQNERFVLAHPDLNLQNVLVAEDGTLRGLIDWDGVSMVPRSVACSFPNWLTFDWDPDNYNYYRDIDCDCEDRHHSPNEMKHYRTLYAQFVHEAASENEVQPNQTALELADRTCKSLLIHSIDRAATNPFSTNKNVCDLVEKIGHITCQKYFKTFCDVYEGNTEQVEHSDQSEALAHAEDGSLIEESSESSDPVFSSTSRTSRDSSKSSDPPSEPDKEQAMEPPFSAPLITTANLEEVQRSSKPDCSALLEEDCMTSSKEKKHWPRVSSLVQKASHHLRAKVRRFQATRTERIEVTRPLIVKDGDESIAIDDGSTSSACSSSKARENPQLELFLTITAQAIETNSFDTDMSAVLAIDETTKEDTTIDQTIEIYTRNQSHRIEGKDANRRDNSAPSPGHAKDLLDSSPVQSERGNDASPNNSLPWYSVHREDNLGRRLRAKLALHHGKKTIEFRASSPTLSVESGGSRRKRILAWIRNTRQKPLSDELKAESSWNSDSTLPEIPKVSHFDMSQLNEACSEMNSSKKGTIDTADGDAFNMAKPVVAGAPKLPSYDAGELVEDGELYEEGFSPSDILDDLADGTFDEARMRRLRLGFAALLNSLQFPCESPTGQ